MHNLFGRLPYHLLTLALPQKDAAFPNVNQNQGFDNPMEIAATLGNAQIQQQLVASRAPVCTYFPMRKSG
jgi:hypothetical protein